MTKQEISFTVKVKYSTEEGGVVCPHAAQDNLLAAIESQRQCGQLTPSLIKADSIAVDLVKVPSATEINRLAMIAASEMVLNETPLPDDFESMDGDALNDFLEANALKDFESFNGGDIMAKIKELAVFAVYFHSEINTQL